MCDCTKVKLMADISCFPLNDGHFTSFKLMQCQDCHKFTGLPSGNLKLGIEKGNEASLRFLLQEMVSEDVMSEMCPLCGKPSPHGEPHKECSDLENARNDR